LSRRFIITGDSCTRTVLTRVLNQVRFNLESMLRLEYYGFRVLLHRVIVD